MWEILEQRSKDDSIARIVDFLLIVVIILSTICIVLSTEPDLSLAHKKLLFTIEVISVLIFTLEYIFRIWVCTEDPNFSKPVSGRIRFALKPFLLIDLLAILPFYLTLFISPDFVFIRIFRLLKIFSMFKLGRYFAAIHIIVNVIHSKKEELIISLFGFLTLLFVSASFIYFAENEAQPHLFSSIPASLWWSVVTLTSVGYGDVVPVTLIGQIVGGFISVLGVVMMGLPTGILGAGFVEEMRKREITLCPRCGLTFQSAANDTLFHDLNKKETPHIE